MNRWRLPWVLILAPLLLAGPSLAQPVHPPPPDVDLVAGEADRPAHPGAQPAKIPVTARIACHADATPMTITTAIFRVRESPPFASGLVSPSTVSHVVQAGECPDPERRLELNATVFLGTRFGGEAFRPYDVHVTLEVRRTYRDVLNYTHGPYHANATFRQGFAPRAGITVHPEIAEAAVGQTAHAEATVDNLSNGPARIELSFRPQTDANDRFQATVEPSTLTLERGDQATARLAIEDERLEPLGTPFAGKLRANVSPADGPLDNNVTEEATVKVHFEGPTPTGVPGLPAGVAAILVAGAAAGSRLLRCR